MGNRVQVISGRAGKYILTVKLMASLLILSLLLQIVLVTGSAILSDVPLIDCFKLSIVNSVDRINFNTQVLDFVIGIFESIIIFIAVFLTYKWAYRKVVITEITNIEKGISIVAWIKVACDLMAFFAQIITVKEISVIKVSLAIAIYVIEVLATIIAIRYFKFNAEQLRETQGYDYRSNYIKGSIIYWILASAFAILLSVSLMLNTVKFVYGAFNNGQVLSIVDISNILQDEGIQKDDKDKEQEKVTYERINIDTTYVSGRYTLIRSLLLGSDGNLYAAINQGSVGTFDFTNVTLKELNIDVYKILENVEKVLVVYSNGGYSAIHILDKNGNLYKLNGVADLSYGKLTLNKMMENVKDIWIEKKEGFETLTIKLSNGSVDYPYYTPNI